jgi:ABC-type transporter MlaC component
MLRRFLLSIGLASIVAMTAAQSAAAAADPAEFIRTLGSQAIEAIRSAASPDQKRAYFHRALHQDFDLRRICRFVLGPYWRPESEAEREAFKGVLEAHLASFYGERLAQYNGESLRVIGSRNWRLSDHGCHGRRRQHGIDRTLGICRVDPAQWRASGRSSRKHGRGPRIW